MASRGYFTINIQRRHVCKKHRTSSTPHPPSLKSTRGRLKNAQSTGGDEIMPSSTANRMRRRQTEPQPPPRWARGTSSARGEGWAMAGTAPAGSTADLRWCTLHRYGVHTGPRKAPAATQTVARTAAGPGKASCTMYTGNNGGQWSLRHKNANSAPGSIGGRH